MLTPDQVTLLGDWHEHPATVSLRIYLKHEIEAAVDRAVSARISQPSIVLGCLERVDVLNQLRRSLDDGSFILLTKPRK